eukprot:CAMPEP_0176223260 /NCGR_PEP_ID=MMETSP0121_2-20121125/20653_1 /TAXON_ID=160619 /ORGANISM="Kryptoperidinium foliaceum, Strain CCMP 1326" /LENGTH=72 /DNA_ID=CAMNT_0017562489 /DNA_START=191 /DNA_END=406 /DNA_ORIENTATION=-
MCLELLSSADEAPASMQSLHVHTATIPANRCRRALLYKSRRGQTKKAWASLSSCALLAAHGRYMEPAGASSW